MWLTKRVLKKRKRTKVNATATASMSAFTEFFTSYSFRKRQCELVQCSRLNSKPFFLHCSHREQTAHPSFLPVFMLCLRQQL